MLGETSIFTLPAKYVLCGDMNMDVSPYKWKFKFFLFFFKNTCCTMNAWIYVGFMIHSIVDKKWNDIPSQTGLSNYDS